MKVYCAWCQKLIREIPDPDGYPEGSDRPVSHGICPECLEKVTKEMEEENASKNTQV